MDAFGRVWSAVSELVRSQWRRLRPFAPYLIALALPGSFVWLPLLALRDLRQQRLRARV